MENTGEGIANSGMDSLRDTEVSENDRLCASCMRCVCSQECVQPDKWYCATVGDGEETFVHDKRGVCFSRTTAGFPAITLIAASLC